MNNHRTRPRIARIWRGRTRRDRADEYEAYNYEEGIKPLLEKALGVQSLREDIGGNRVRHDFILGECRSHVAFYGRGSNPYSPPRARS